MEEIIISIKPVFWSQIRSGCKRYEYRKRFPVFEAGCRAFVYVSSPSKRVEGVVVFGPAVTGTPETLAALPYAGTGVAEYLRGAGTPMALPVLSVRVFQSFFTLDRLREGLPGFVPPQSWMYARKGFLGMLGNDAYPPRPVS